MRCPSCRKPLKITDREVFLKKALVRKTRWALCDLINDTAYRVVAELREESKLDYPSDLDKLSRKLILHYRKAIWNVARKFLGQRPKK